MAEEKKRQSSAPKRSEQQKQSDRAFIAGEIVKCTQIREIARKLNEKNQVEGRGYTLHHTQIFWDLKVIYKEWREQRSEFIEEKMELELAKLDKIETECWEAWERSKEGRRKTVIDGGELNQAGMSGGRLREREVETTFGDTRFLDIIQKCMERRAALLGLNAPTRSFSIGINSTLTKEEIEAEIEQKWKIQT